MDLTLGSSKLKQMSNSMDLTLGSSLTAANLSRAQRGRDRAREERAFRDSLDALVIFFVSNHGAAIRRNIRQA